MNQVNQIDLINRQIFKGNFAYSNFFGFMPFLESYITF
jgi:hypothetical protein